MPNDFFDVCEPKAIDGLGNIVSSNTEASANDRLCSRMGMGIGRHTAISPQQAGLGSTLRLSLKIQDTRLLSPVNSSPRKFPSRFADPYAPGIGDWPNRLYFSEVLPEYAAEFQSSGSGGRRLRSKRRRRCQWPLVGPQLLLRTRSGRFFALIPRSGR